MPSAKVNRRAQKLAKAETTSPSGTLLPQHEHSSSSEALVSGTSDSESEPGIEVPLRDVIDAEDSLPHFPEFRRREQNPAQTADESTSTRNYELETILSASESSSVSLPTYSTSNLRDTIQSQSDHEDPPPRDQNISMDVSLPRNRRSSNNMHPITRWITGNTRPQVSRQTSLMPLELDTSTHDVPSKSPRTPTNIGTRSSSSSSGSYKTPQRTATGDSSEMSTQSAFSGTPTRRSSTSSNKSVRFEEASTLQHAGKSSLKRTRSPFEILIQELNLDRVFYDPELDVLNRFCLEYVELSKLTLSKHWSIIRSKSHFTRVYQYMKEQTEDQGTPAVASPPPISKPVVHYGLFLDHFRASSSRIFDPKVPLPHFSHGHRLNEHRFQRIVEGIFTRRHFLGSSVGVSAEKLSDLS